MTTISISLSDLQFARLRALAEKTGLTPDEYLKRRVERLIDSDEAFRKAAEYVLEKNEELYRRLA